MFYCGIPPLPVVIFLCDTTTSISGLFLDQTDNALCLIKSLMLTTHFFNKFCNWLNEQQVTFSSSFVAANKSKHTKLAYKYVDPLSCEQIVQCYSIMYRQYHLWNGWDDIGVAMLCPNPTVPNLSPNKHESTIQVGSSDHSWSFLVVRAMTMTMTIHSNSVLLVLVASTKFLNMFKKFV